MSNRKNVQKSEIKTGNVKNRPLKKSEVVVKSEIFVKKVGNVQNILNFFFEFVKKNIWGNFQTMMLNIFLTTFGKSFLW